MRRRAIGIKREDSLRKDLVSGEIVKVGGSFRPRWVRDWGNVYLLSGIAKRIALEQVLKRIYPDRWQELLYLAIYQVLEKFYQAWIAEQGDITSLSSYSELIEGIEWGYNRR